MPEMISGFWTAVSKMKLEVSKLDQSPIDVRGYYTNNSAKDLPASLHVDWDALDLVSLHFQCSPFHKSDLSWLVCVRCKKVIQ
jgi:hypothetical protein